MVKRKASSEHSEAPETPTPTYIGPFGAELIVIIARYLPGKDTVRWALCSKNLCNLILYEETIWKPAVLAEWAPVMSPERLAELVSVANGSYRKVYKRMIVSRSLKAEVEKPIHSYSSKYESPSSGYTTKYVWSSPGYPAGTFVGRLLCEGKENQAKFVVEAFDYVNNKVVQSWDLSTQFQNHTFFFSQGNEFTHNNRFICIGVRFPLPDFEEVHYSKILIFDIETGNMPCFTLDEAGEQPIYLRGSTVWTYGIFIDEDAEVPPHSGGPADYYIKSYSCTDGKLKICWPVPPRPDPGLVHSQWHPKTCIDDSHFICRDSTNGFSLVEINSAKIIAKFVFAPDANLYSNNYGILRIYLSQDMIVVHTLQNLVVWERPYEYQEAEIFPRFSLAFKDQPNHLNWVIPNGPETILYRSEQQDLFIVSHIFSENPQITKIHDGVTSEDMDKKWTRHANNTYVERNFVLQTYEQGLDVKGWDLQKRKEFLNWDIRDLIFHTLTTSDFGNGEIFMDGPFLVVKREGLHVWDLSGHISVMKLRNRPKKAKK